MPQQRMTEWQRSAQVVPEPLLHPLPVQPPHCSTGEALSPVQTGLPSAGQFRQMALVFNGQNSTRCPSSNCPAGHHPDSCQGMPLKHFSTFVETGPAARCVGDNALQTAENGQAASTAQQEQQGLKPPADSPRVATAAAQHQAADAALPSVATIVQQGHLMTFPVVQQPYQGSFRFHTHASTDEGLLSGACCTPMLANQASSSCRSPGDHL